MNEIILPHILENNMMTDSDTYFSLTLTCKSICMLATSEYVCRILCKYMFGVSVLDYRYSKWRSFYYYLIRRSKFDYRRCTIYKCSGAVSDSGSSLKHGDIVIYDYHTYIIDNPMICWEDRGNGNSLQVITKFPIAYWSTYMSLYNINWNKDLFVDEIVRNAKYVNGDIKSQISYEYINYYFVISNGDEGRLNTLKYDILTGYYTWTYRENKFDPHSYFTLHGARAHEIG